MNKTLVADSTAIRVALWRALHLEVDARPHIFEDHFALRLAAPEENWRNRPDMHPQGTAPFRASIVARARFIEDVLQAEIDRGVDQYVMLGSGLDTFAQRRADAALKLHLYEIDKPETIEWKRQRLKEEGLTCPPWQKFVAVNFEARESWWEKLLAAGFNIKKPAMVTSIGVSMYLTKEAIVETLQQMASLAKGSTFIMTFMLPLDLVDPADRPGYEMSLKGAQRSGTPFISFFSPEEMLELARSLGFQKLQHLSTSDLVPRYFTGRTDGLRPSTGEEFLIISI